MYATLHRALREGHVPWDPSWCVPAPPATPQDTANDWHGWQPVLGDRNGARRCFVAVEFVPWVAQASNAGPQGPRDPSFPQWPACVWMPRWVLRVETAFCGAHDRDHLFWTLNKRRDLRVSAYSLFCLYAPDAGATPDERNAREWTLVRKLRALVLGSPEP